MAFDLYKTFNFLIIFTCGWLGRCNGECDLMPGAPQVCVKGWSPWTQCTSTGDYKMDAALLKSQLHIINARLPFAYFASTVESKMVQERRNLDKYIASLGISMSWSNMTKPPPPINTTKPALPKPIQNCGSFLFNSTRNGSVIFNFSLDHQQIIMHISVWKHWGEISLMNSTSHPYIIQFSNGLQKEADGMRLQLASRNGKTVPIVRDMHVSHNGSFEMDSMHNFRVLGSVESGDWVNVSISRECGTDPKDQDIDLCQYPVHMHIPQGPQVQLPKSLFYCVKSFMKIDVAHVANLLHDTINMHILECGGMDPITYLGESWIHSGLANMYGKMTAGRNHNEPMGMNDYKTSTADEPMIGKGSASVSASAKGQGVASTSGRITVSMGPDGKPIVHVSGNATGDQASVVIKPINKTSNHSTPVNGQGDNGDFNERFEMVISLLVLIEASPSLLAPFMQFRYCKCDGTFLEAEAALWDRTEKTMELMMQINRPMEARGTVWGSLKHVIGSTKGHLFTIFGYQTMHAVSPQPQGNYSSTDNYTTYMNQNDPIHIDATAFGSIGVDLIWNGTWNETVEPRPTTARPPRFCPPPLITGNKMLDDLLQRLTDAACMMSKMGDRLQMREELFTTALTEETVKLIHYNSVKLGMEESSLLTDLIKTLQNITVKYSLNMTTEEWIKEWEPMNKRLQKLEDPQENFKLLKITVEMLISDAEDAAIKKLYELLTTQENVRTLEARPRLVLQLVVVLQMARSAYSFGSCQRRCDNLLMYLLLRQQLLHIFLQHVMQKFVKQDQSCRLLADLMRHGPSRAPWQNISFFEHSSRLWIGDVLQMVEEINKNEAMHGITIGNPNPGAKLTNDNNMTQNNNNHGNWNKSIITPLYNAHMCGFCYRRFRSCRDEFMSWLDQKLESEVCEESNQPCVVPPLRDATCNYDQFLPRNTGPQVSYKNEELGRKIKWRLDNKWMNTMGTNQSVMHCSKIAGLCHCCCGAYFPVVTNGVTICRKHGSDNETISLEPEPIFIKSNSNLNQIALIPPDFPVCPNSRYSSYSTCSPVGDNEEMAEFMKETNDKGCKDMPIEVAIAITKAHGINTIMQFSNRSKRQAVKHRCGLCSKRFSCCSNASSWWDQAVKTTVCLEYKDPCILPKLGSGCDYGLMNPSADIIAHNFDGTLEQKSRIVGITIQSFAGRRDTDMDCVSHNDQCYCCCNDHSPQLLNGIMACLYKPANRTIATSDTCAKNEDWKWCSSDGCEATCDSPESQCINDGLCSSQLAGCYCKLGYVRYGRMCLNKSDCPLVVSPIVPTCGHADWSKWSMCEPVDGSVGDPLSTAVQYANHLKDIGCTALMPADIEALFTTIPVSDHNARKKRSVAERGCGYCSTRTRCCRNTNEWHKQATEKSVCMGDESYSKPCVISTESSTNWSCQSLHQQIFFNYTNHFQQAVVPDSQFKAEIAGKLSSLNYPIQNPSFNCIK